MKYQLICMTRYAIYCFLHHFYRRRRLLLDGRLYSQRYKCHRESWGRESIKYSEHLLMSGGPLQCVYWITAFCSMSLLLALCKHVSQCTLHRVSEQTSKESEKERQKRGWKKSNHENHFLFLCASGVWCGYCRCCCVGFGRSSNCVRLSLDFRTSISSRIIVFIQLFASFGKAVCV